MIVDDEPAAVEALELLCRRTGGADIVGVAANGESALRLASDRAPQAVFLDIGMPGLSGMQVAQALAARPDPPVVVFVTAYDRFAAEAFDLAVADYVLKPVDPPRFQRAVERVEAALKIRAAEVSSRAYSRWIWAPSRGGMVRIAMEAIARIDAERDYVRLSTGGASYLIRRSIAQLASQLDPARFVRVHRSVILRLADIVELRHLGNGAWAAVDAAGREVRIGRSYLASVRQRLGLP